jgi:hypothetical protein
MTTSGRRTSRVPRALEPTNVEAAQSLRDCAINIGDLLLSLQPGIDETEGHQ